MKDIDQELSQLDSIQQVEAPPFLLTRIKAQIDAVSQQQIPRFWAWGLATSCMVLLLLNLFVLQAQWSPTSDSITLLLEEMNVYPQNDIYYE